MQSYQYQPARSAMRGVGMQSQAHMTPEAAAVAAIQSVAPPHINPQPAFKVSFTKSNVQLYFGGGIEGAIDYEYSDRRDAAVGFTDEKASEASASQFSAYLGEVRSVRKRQWEGYWDRKLELNEDILELEHEIFQDSYARQSMLDSDGDSVRRSRFPPNVPIIRANVGAFDLPKPSSVIVPDPRESILIPDNAANYRRTMMPTAMSMQNQRKPMLRK